MNQSDQEETHEPLSEPLTSQEKPTETEKPVLAIDQPKPEVKTPFYKQRRNILGIALVLVLAATGAFVLTDQNKQSTLTDNDTKASQRLLGAEVTILDGTAQVSSDKTNWRDIKAATAVAQGETVRTAENSRIVVTLDDGSAVRLNGSSTAQFTSLAGDNVVITNESGEVYTRVVKSDRKFNVVVNGETFQALGTAYKTINKTDTKGVEVYESAVQAKLAKQSVAEGKRFYQVAAQVDLVNKVSDIPLDQLSKDDFLKWNLENDKKATEFKDKLGYLKKLEETPAVVQPAPAPTPVPAGSTAGIVLSGSKVDAGVSFAWKVTGLSVTKGFKIVKSLSANPTFGKDDATYVSDSAARSYKWSIKDGKTYHFRICVYTGTSCTNYSNDITVTAPAYQAPAPPTGSLSLTHLGGKNFGWTLSGSAPYGHKLVWSTSANASYPTATGGGIKFYNEGSTTSASIDSGSGSYYVRVCMYYESSCVNYSNEVYVTIP